MRVAVLEAAEADPVDQPFGALAPLAFADHAQLERKLDVLAQRAPRIEIVGLRDVADRAVDAGVALAAVEHLAARRRKQPDDQVHQRRLAASGRPDDGEEFAVVDLEVGLEQRLHAPALAAEDVTDDARSRSPHRTGEGSGASAVAPAQERPAWLSRNDWPSVAVSDTRVKAPERVSRIGSRDVKRASRRRVVFALHTALVPHAPRLALAACADCFLPSRWPTGRGRSARSPQQGEDRHEAAASGNEVRPPARRQKPSAQADFRRAAAAGPDPAHRPPSSRAAFAPAAGCLRPARAAPTMSTASHRRSCRPTVRSTASRIRSASRGGSTKTSERCWPRSAPAFPTSCASISTIRPCARCIPITRFAARCSKARFRPRRPTCISASRAPARPSRCRSWRRCPAPASRSSTRPSRRATRFRPCPATARR